MTPSKAKLDVDPRQTALLVIDVQQALFSRPTPIHLADKLLNNINTLIAKWDQAGGLVVYIQHSNKNMLVKDTPDWEIHPEIKIIKAGSRIYKQHGNAFEQTELHDLLSSRGMDQIVITGLVSQGCVMRTCRGALSLGYQVILVEDGHSNYSKDAAGIIQEWNQQLADEGAILLATDRITLKEN